MLLCNLISLENETTRHCERSAALQTVRRGSGLPRFARNDEKGLPRALFALLG
jgi:hypothetical protein